MSGGENCADLYWAGVDAKKTQCASRRRACLGVKLRGSVLGGCSHWAGLRRVSRLSTGRERVQKRNRQRELEQRAFCGESCEGLSWVNCILGRAKI